MSVGRECRLKRMMPATAQRSAPAMKHGGRVTSPPLFTASRPLHPRMILRASAEVDGDRKDGVLASLALLAFLRCASSDPIEAVGTARDDRRTAADSDVPVVSHPYLYTTARS